MKIISEHDVNKLIDTWYEGIPITKFMALNVLTFTQSSLELSASMDTNINVHQTMFAGSVYTLATLCGWGLIHLQMQARELDGSIVLAHADIKYRRPIVQQPRAIALTENLTGNWSTLCENNKCRLEQSVALYDGEQETGSFIGRYVIIPHT